MPQLCLKCLKEKARRVPELDKQDKRTQHDEPIKKGTFMGHMGHQTRQEPAKPATNREGAMNEGPRIGPQRVLMALILKYRDKGLKGLKAGGLIGHQRGKRGNKAMRIQFNEFGIGLCNGAVKG